MSLLNTQGIKIIFKNGDVEYVDPLLGQTTTDTHLKIWNGFYLYWYALDEIEKTEVYNVDESRDIGRDSR